jgi:hypothetical protein
VIWDKQLRKSERRGVVTDGWQRNSVVVRSKLSFQFQTSVRTPIVPCLNCKLHSNRLEHSMLASSFCKGTRASCLGLHCFCNPTLSNDSFSRLSSFVHRSTLPCVLNLWSGLVCGSQGRPIARANSATALGPGTAGAPTHVYLNCYFLCTPCLVYKCNRPSFFFKHRNRPSR